MSKLTRILTDVQSVYITNW